MDINEICIRVLRKGVANGEISVNYIKLNYAVGLQKARRIMDWMQEKGYIERRGKDNELSKVLISLEEFEKMYGEK